MMKLLFFVTLFFYNFLLAYDPPYTIKKFQPVLKSSKLQAPTSHYDKQWGTKYGKFQGVAHKYFYLQDNKYLTFFMCGYKHRSELRQKQDWKVEDNKPHILKCEVKIDPVTTYREFTFLQIHADPTSKIKNNPSINKPLLRIVWKRSHKHKYDHLWAIICTNTDPKNSTYTKIDLGERKNIFQKFKIIVQNSKMSIIIDGKQKVLFDVNYWNGMWNYFKAGVYLQSEGCAQSTFKELYWK